MLWDTDNVIEFASSASLRQVISFWKLRHIFVLGPSKMAADSHASWSWAYSHSAAHSFSVRSSSHSSTLQYVHFLTSFSFTSTLFISQAMLGIENMPTAKSSLCRANISPLNKGNTILRIAWAIMGCPASCSSRLTYVLNYEKLHIVQAVLFASFPLHDQLTLWNIFF